MCVSLALRVCFSKEFMAFAAPVAQCDAGNHTGTLSMKDGRCPVEMCPCGYEYCTEGLAAGAHTKVYFVL